MQDCQQRCESGYNTPKPEKEFITGKNFNTWGCGYVHFGLFTEAPNSDGQNVDFVVVQ
jgi:hypothetical protein